MPRQQQDPIIRADDPFIDLLALIPDVKPTSQVQPTPNLIYIPNPSTLSKSTEMIQGPKTPYKLIVDSWIEENKYHASLQPHINKLQPHINKLVTLLGTLEELNSSSIDNVHELAKEGINYRTIIPKIEKELNYFKPKSKPLPMYVQLAKDLGIMQVNNYYARQNQQTNLKRDKKRTH
ncbi:MAG: hypothetical protein ACP5N2_01365 [Candidatus Nanoarchaeia archaeon]